MKNKSVFKLSPSTKVTLEVMVLPSLLVLMVVLVLSVFVATNNPVDTGAHTVDSVSMTYYPVVTPKGVTLHHYYH